MVLCAGRDQRIAVGSLPRPPTLTPRLQTLRRGGIRSIMRTLGGRIGVTGNHDPEPFGLSDGTAFVFSPALQRAGRDRLTLGKIRDLTLFDCLRAPYHPNWQHQPGVGKAKICHMLFALKAQGKGTSCHTLDLQSTMCRRTDPWPTSARDGWAGMWCAARTRCSSICPVCKT